jgi:hypothetical protein
MSKFYRTSILTAFLAMFSIVTWGQNISGVVTDEENRPIPGAFVLVKGTSNGTASDQIGNYTLKTGTGTFEIEVKALNFTTLFKTVTVGNADVKQNFKLSSGSLTLDNVEIRIYCKN